MDPAEENHILNTFRQISREKGQTMIVVTHNLSSIAEHADNVLCVSESIYPWTAFDSKLSIDIWKKVESWNKELMRSSWK